MSVDERNNSGAQGPSGRARLCPKSSEALDQLIERGLDESRVDPAHKARCQHVARLLSALGKGESWCCPNKMAQSTAQRAAMVPMSETPASEPGVELSHDDADALEVLVQERFDARRVPSGVRARAERIGALLAPLDQVDVRIEASERDDLVARTLAGVQADVERSQRTMRVRHEAAPARRGVRLMDLAAVAAVLTVGTALIWPAVINARQSAMQVAGAGRMSAVGQAAGQYASDFRGSMPMASASLVGTPWWNVGKPQESNSANLFTLRRTGYATQQQLTSPGNREAPAAELPRDAWDWASFEQISYSYQNQFARERACMKTAPARFIVLADRSPVVLRAWRGERTVYFDENSPNFNGRGQNALHTDGSTEWLTTPFTAQGDNIWLPRQIETMLRCAERLARGDRHCEPLKGVEGPSAKDDVFLCP